MPRPSRPTILALVLGVLSYGGRVWDALDHSHALETWLKHGSLGILGEVVSQLIANGWLFVFLGLILWYHDSRSAARVDVKQTPGVEGDDINRLRQNVAKQIDEVYQASLARDEARAERDACKKELQDVTALRDRAQGELRAVHRQLAAAPTKAAVEGLIEERDSLRLQLREIVTPAVVMPAPSKPLLSGRVKRFEMLDVADLSELEFADFERESGRRPTVSEGLRTIFSRPPGAWYIAWFQIEAGGGQSKATDWAFEVRGIGGEGYPCTFVPRNWEAPKSWPALEYSTLERIENMYLEKPYVYNVFVHLVCQAAREQIRFETFEARCKDNEGQEIVLRMT